LASTTLLGATSQGGFHRFGSLFEALFKVARTTLLGATMIVGTASSKQGGGGHLGRWLLTRKMTKI